MAGASARDLRARLAEHIAEHDLFSEPGLALLAVSGGPDSIALLYVMGDLAPDLDLRLAVAHVDHGIHLDSGRWAGHVAESARRLGLPYHEVALHLGPDASETRARRERYRALRQLQRGLRARYLVTAHHADDQIETVLYRFLRGSGPAGLAGMASVGAGGLVRPLLPFRGTELAEWLEQRAPEVTPHVDPANADQRHDRSWLRYVLMPLLRARFPDVERRIGETRAQAASERAAWETLVLEDEALQCRAIPRGVEVARGPFARYDKALSVALLRALGRVLGCRLGAGRAATLARFAVAAPSGRTLELGQGWIAETAFDRLRVCQIDAGAGVGATGEPVTVGLGDEGEARWGLWGITWRREPAGAIRRTGLWTWVTPGACVLRAFQDGDRIRPLGGVGHRPVRRLLMEARVARAERASYPVVIRGREVLWIPGLCRSDAALPRPGEPAVRLDARRV